MKRMAAQEPPAPEVNAPEEAVFRDRLLGVDGTGGVEAAAGPEEGRECELVQPDQGEGDGFHDDIRFRNIDVSDEMNESLRSGQRASPDSGRVMTMRSRDSVKSALFLRKSSRNLRLTRFLVTAGPTFRLATTARREWSSPFLWKTRVK
jgi:hypothetical protein